VLVWLKVLLKELASLMARPVACWPDYRLFQQ
jgi:hypothetical protein